MGVDDAARLFALASELGVDPKAWRACLTCWWP